ncbi:MAG: GT4 family glycosyltransferase PelF [Spirochaetales bacterium]|nr:GT4 family glycosyltransferase PelF [Spirochaetales bacterium]
MDDICLIVESDGELLTQGIPAPVHDLILTLPDVRFAVVTIAHRPYAVNSLVARLPANVKTLVTVGLEESFLPRVKTPCKKKRREFWAQLAALYERPLEEKTRHCEAVLLGLAHDESRVQSYADVARAREFWDILCAEYRRRCPGVPFLDYAWIFRQTQLPYFQLMQTPLPRAKAYHVFSSRYAGCAGLAAKVRYRSHLIFDVRSDFFIEDTPALSQAFFTDMREVLRGLPVPSLEAYIKTYNATLKTFRFLAGFYADSVVTPNRGAVGSFLKPEAEYKCLIVPASGERLPERPEKKPARETFSIGLLSDVTQASDVKSFIRACRLLLDEEKKVTFTVLGLEKVHTGYLEECIDLRSQLGLEFQLNILYNSDVSGALAGFDAVVLGNGNGRQRKAVLSQVLQSGKPLVAVKRGVNPEIIAGLSSEDRALGECGILVESGSPQSLARALCVLIDDRKLAREMGKIAVRRFDQFYSHSIHLNSFASLYKNFL